jgi:hypothetical protein
MTINFAANAPDLIGSIGVALLLAAFFANITGRLRSDSVVYSGINLIGALLSCLASYMINYLPFVVLEAVWAIVAATATVRHSLTR